MLQVKPICSGADRSISKLRANFDAHSYASNPSIFAVGDEPSKKSKISSAAKPKLNILNILKSHNISNNKPTGNKIVVPIKIPISSKKVVEPANKEEKVDPLHASYAKTKHYLPIQKIGKPLAEVTMLSNIQVKQEKESDQNPFPQISKKLEYQHFNNNEENEIAHLCRLKKENQGVNSKASDINVDCDLTSLSWLITSKNKNLMDIIQKCNPDVGESNKSKINSIFTALSQVQSKVNIYI